MGSLVPYIALVKPPEMMLPRVSRGMINCIKNVHEANYVLRAHLHTNALDFWAGCTFRRLCYCRSHIKNENLAFLKRLTQRHTTSRIFLMVRNSVCLNRLLFWSRKQDNKVHKTSSIWQLLIPHCQLNILYMPQEIAKLFDQACI